MTLPPVLWGSNIPSVLFLTLWDRQAYGLAHSAGDGTASTGGGETR